MESARQVTDQPDHSHRMGNLHIAHEPAPDVTAAQILRANQRDAEIDGYYILIDPPSVWIERIDEAIVAPMLSPNSSFIALRAGTQMSGANINEPPAAEGTNRSVDFLVTRRSAPRHVAFSATQD